MTFQPIERIASSQEALIGALDANNLAAIEAAVADLGAAVGDLRRSADAEALSEHLPTAMALNQAARVRVNFLTDNNRRRLHAMAAIRGASSGLTYSRS